MGKFLRRSWNKYSKLGKRRKKKQVWRNPNGRDNKMREKRKGYPAVVSIGYRGEKDKRESLKNKKPVWVMNVNDLKSIKKENIVVVGSVGRKKKIQIAKKLLENKIDVYNMNPEKYLKLNKGKEDESKK